MNFGRESVFLHILQRSVGIIFYSQISCTLANEMDSFLSLLLLQQIPFQQGSYMSLRASDARTEGQASVSRKEIRQVVRMIILASRSGKAGQFPATTLP